MVSAFSAGCPADRTEGGNFRQGSLSMCERLPLPPLVFPLIFNKQELRLSATGPQFVPTTKKNTNMATTPGRACSVPKVRPLSLHLLFEPAQM